MDVSDLIAANAPIGGYPTLAIGDASPVKPPIKVPADMPASSVSAAKAAYRATGAYTEAEIDAAFAAHAPDKTQAPVHIASEGVALGSDAMQRAYQTAFDHATDKGAVLAEAHRAGVQIKGPNGQFLAADGVEGNQIAYSFQYPDSDEVEADDLASFDGLMKEGMNALHVPQATAQAFVTTIVDTANALPENASEEEMRQIFEREGNTLKSLADGPEIIRLALAGDAALKKASPDLHAAISAGWGFHSAAAQLALASLARHLKL